MFDVVQKDAGAAPIRLTLQLNETNLAVRRLRLCDSKTTAIPLPFRGWLDASQRKPVRMWKLNLHKEGNKP
ncbi:hypothetical protein J2Y39_005144 [Pseudomonas sp. 2957]|uniref:hypothetical protein n=1 Tax=Pseudomonas TaxID=286 RepID=UPI0012E3948B|nr:MULTISPECIES: hypothetical protein [unclassified Pseudomonas]MDR6950506.1 hypothetical protein [Pseudomonas sp. 2957]WLG63202.1 hypothetical protein PSH90_03565 [Pseudomonas sp. FP1762]